MGLSEVTGLRGKSGYLCPLVAWAHISRKSLSYLGRAGTWSGGGWFWYLLRGEYQVNTDIRAYDWLALAEVRSLTPLRTRSISHPLPG